VSVATVMPMLEILLLRRGPQDLPADFPVLGFWMGASLFSGVLVAAPQHGFAPSLLLGALDLLVLYLFVLALLRVKDASTGRWLQTYTALVGVSAVLGLVMTALLWVVPPDFENGSVPAPAMVLYLGLVVWLLLAFGHVFQKALDLGLRMTGVAIALGFLILSSVVTQLAIGWVAA
jgi:hypothetical protein